MPKNINLNDLSIANFDQLLDVNVKGGRRSYSRNSYSRPSYSRPSFSRTTTKRPGNCSWCWRR